MNNYEAKNLFILVIQNSVLVLFFVQNVDLVILYSYLFNSRFLHLQCVLSFKCVVTFLFGCCKVCVNVAKICRGKIWEQIDTSTNVPSKLIVCSFEISPNLY